MVRWLSLVLILMAVPAMGEPLSFRFSWEGGNGFTMDGAVAFDPDARPDPWLRESDVTCFQVEGRRDGEPVGRWTLTMLRPETTWRLHFDLTTQVFLVDGDGSEVWMPQAWNMDGAGANCGRPGFGFNAGNVAQDLCVDGRLIVASQRPPAAPFAAERAQVQFDRDACRVPPLLSDLDLPPGVTRTGATLSEP